MEKWRLLDPGPMPAWRQMALDAVVIRARAEGRAPNTFRFMEFNPDAVLVGYHQAIDLELRRDECEALGIEYNRRITGGGAIYLDSRQLGWEICLRKDDPGLPADPETVYRRLSTVVIETLARWGIEARFRPVNDVEVDGRKISGTGGTEWGDALIYQGTLLVDFDVDTMIRVLRLPIEKLSDKEVDSFRRRTVTMRELLGEAPEMTAVKGAMVEAAARVLGIDWGPPGLTPEEQEEWETIQDTYRDPEWIDRRKPPAVEPELRTVSTKAPGGLIKASVIVDPGAKRIRRAFITGDFFVYPERAVMDLEAMLKEAPADIRKIEELLRRHYDQGNRYIGVAVEDWLRLFEQALA
ncbi:lipoate--protein ligase family protein [Kyrpidia tusciae]|uniref:Biotin/lipoate A/B protein ligase n=1 Tax=Kyrpidia tusciae (strain DSM 2912 / NBRC 15312 / T2) TaxID=562970 RepID=D5WTA4_KYRT2|nr:lipoate--protein ligase family protein [Kyrpidia tusciae]ADG07140.1 biotin/lipoate A/B protein ligase [Kyrpidia tusciae DSM 2912]